MPSASLKRYAYLSIAAALATILLKGVAWWLTGSVGLLSDALESFVNLAGALMALAMLSLAMEPADENHAYGHGKAEYFSSAFEGFLILVAAGSIAYAGIDRLLHPQAIESVGVGLAVSVVASIINLVTARTLMAVGKKHHSITLEADAHHLLTDVWTSAGVILGVGLVWQLVQLGMSFDTPNSLVKKLLPRAAEGLNPAPASAVYLATKSFGVSADAVPAPASSNRARAIFFAVITSPWGMNC